MVMEMTREMEDTAREISERVRPQIEEAKRRLGKINEKVTGFVKEHPGKCLIGALAVGYIVGKIASR
jgi:hypothetical protein